MKILGAGLPRTGTSSLREALEMLGLGPCYHMSEAYGRRDHDALWLDAARRGETDWGALFADYQSCVDAPGCWFVEPLTRHFSDARIILTTRDANAWFKSAIHTVFSPAYLAELHKTAFGPVASATGMRFLRTPGLRMSESPMSGPANALRAFEAHNAYVRDIVPAGRLLVLDVQEGWGPLCDFLDLPEPSAPFPWFNRRDEFAEVMKPPA